MSTSTNTDSPRPAVQKTDDLPENTGLSFLKGKLWLYLIIFFGVIALGKVISAGTQQELWNQGTRNAISATLLFLVLCAGLVNVHICFTALILYTPFMDAIPGSFGGLYPALNLFNLLSTIVLLCWFVDKVKKERPFLVVNRATKFALLFAFLSVLSYIVNGFGYGTYYLSTMIFNLKRWVDPVLLFLIASGLTYKRSLRKDMLIVLLLGAAMFIFLAIKDAGQVTHFAEERRIRGAGDQPNMLGAFTVDYMFLFFGLLLVNYRKFIFWLNTLPFWWGIRTVALSFSRGAYTSFVIASLVISFIKNKFVFVLVVAVYIFIANNLWVLPQAVKERIEMTVSGQEMFNYGATFETSTAQRIDAWKAVIPIIKEKPFLGYGIGMVQAYLSNYAGILIGDVHNSYLLLAAEYGILTLIVFLLSLFTGLRVAWFVYQHSQDGIFKGAALGFFAGIIGLAINCLFGSHMTAVWEIGYFWILLAIFANEEKELRQEMIDRR